MQQFLFASPKKASGTSRHRMRRPSLESLDGRLLLSAAPVIFSTIGANANVGADLNPTAPAGAIIFTPSQSASTIENSIQSHGPNTTFFFDAGTYQNLGIDPLAGDTFIGQHGTTLTSTTVDHVFESPNPNVTIQNFVITGYVPETFTGNIQADAGTGVPGAINWVVDHCEMSGCDYVAIDVLDGSSITNCYFHNNAAAGIGCDSLAEDPGQPTYHTPNGLPILVQNNLVENNNPNGVTDPTVAASGIKIFECNNCTIANNTVIGNNGQGIWLDTCRGGDVVANNLVENNDDKGIFNEITNGSLITGNVVENNPLEAIVVWDGTNVSVTNNTLSGPQPYFYTYSLPRNDDNTTWILLNVTSSGNIINGVLNTQPPVFIPTQPGGPEPPDVIPTGSVPMPTRRKRIRSQEVLRLRFRSCCSTAPRRITPRALPTPRPVAIGNAGQVSVTDGESGNLVSLTASITSLHTGDVLTDSVTGTSITSSYNAGTGVLTLSGSDTLAHYQQVLASVAYNNTAGSPGVGAETVSVVASDGTNSSAAALATVNINVTADTLFRVGR